MSTYTSGSGTAVARAGVLIEARSRKQAIVYAIKITLYVAHVFLDTMFGRRYRMFLYPHYHHHRLCSEYRSAGGSRPLHPGREHHRELKMNIAYISVVDYIHSMGGSCLLTPYSYVGV